MASSYSGKVPAFKTVEEELAYWKKRSSTFEQKYQALNNENRRIPALYLGPSLGPALPPAKRQRVSIAHFDPSLPFPHLPESVCHKIMKYLSGKELLTALEVSKVWKQYIEDRRTLIDRALDEVVMIPKVNDYSLSLLNDTFSASRKRREYKHMKGSFILEKKIHLILPHYYSASLETLEIYDKVGTQNSYISQLKEITFPKLKKLKYTGLGFGQLKKFSFPELKYLEVHPFPNRAGHNPWTSVLGSDIKIGSLREVLTKLPKLKFFVANVKVVDYEENPPNPAQPQLEQISIGSYFPNFMKDHQSSLQILEIHAHINLAELSLVLSNMKVLKSLTIGGIARTHRENFESNESIEVLKIQNFKKDVLQILQHLILCLPSLKELVLGSMMNIEVIRFLASSTPSLKQLIFKEMSGPAMVVYDDIRANPQQHVNSSFELIAEPYYDFEDIKKKFAQKD